MNLGCRSQSMPWIFCFGIISTWWRGEGEEINTNQTLWRTPPLYLSLYSLHPPTLCNLPSSTHSSFIPSAIHLVFVVRLPLGWKLCVYAPLCMCVCSRVCLKALWNDTFIQSVLYFLILLTITAWVNRRCSSVFFSGFLWLSEYHVVEWECFYKCCIAVTGEAFRVVCFLVPMQVHIFFSFFFLTWKC